jgi:hypothetical protein
MIVLMRSLPIHVIADFQLPIADWTGLLRIKHRAAEVADSIAYSQR